MTRLTASRARSFRLLAFLGVLLAGAAPACSGTKAPSPASLPTVRFAFIQAVDQLPYLVMRDRGFDRDNGFTLSEEQVAGGVAALDAMSAGTADAAYSGSVQVFAAARAGKVPRDLLVVGANTVADPQHPATAVVVAHGITGWRALDGQTIGVNQVGSLSWVAARIRMLREGVTGFRFVEIPFANQGLAMAGGDLAAAVMIEPFLTQSLLRGDGTRLDWVIGGDPFPRFPYTFIVVRSELARDRPEVVRGFLRAHLEAVRWIGDHEADARAILAHKLGVDQRVAQAMRLNTYVPDGRFDAELIVQVQATIARADPSEVPVKAADLYDDGLLLDVLRTRR